MKNLSDVRRESTICGRRTLRASFQEKVGRSSKHKNAKIGIHNNFIYRKMCKNVKKKKYDKTNTREH